MKAEEFGNGGMAAQGTKFAELFETKRLCGLAFEDANDVLGALAALALGELSGCWSGLAIERVGDDSAITDGPGGGGSAEAHVRLGKEAAFVLGTLQALEGRGGRIADGADGRRTLNELAAFESDPFRSGEGDAGIEQNLNAGLFHFLAGELAELGTDLGKELVSRMNENDTNVFAAKIVKVTGAAPEQIVYFAGGLGAAESATNDDEGKVPSAPFRVSANLGGFHSLHDVGTERGGVTDAFERERMVGHSGNDIEVGGAAASDDDLIVRHAGGMALIGLVLDFLFCQVDV
jgi:hypothetical protein